MLVVIALGCSGSGHVVVVIDSTMSRGSVEVVALPMSPARASVAATLDGAPPDSHARLRVLEDSATRFDGRFQRLRDSLNTDVRALDTADRRTPAYARRYAEIRRRTMIADSIRTRRDAVRSQATELRTKLSAEVARSPRPTPNAREIPLTDASGRRVRRERMTAPNVTLSLEPGPWWIGVASPDSEPARYDSLTVRRGRTDTLRFVAPSRR
jgi:hypothetical protein